MYLRGRCVGGRCVYLRGTRLLGRLEVSEATMLAQTATEVSFDAGETIALEDTPGTTAGGRRALSMAVRRVFAGDGLWGCGKHAWGDLQRW